MSFERVTTVADLSLKARLSLAWWQEQATKIQVLNDLEAELPSGFQLDSLHPEAVGLRELATDELSPEALASMYDRPPLVVDFDALQGV